MPGSASPTPQRLALAPTERDLLVAMASKVLGNSAVAAATAASLMRLGVDVRTVDRLIPGFGQAVIVDGFMFKKVEPDAESPENFGLFVRRAAK